MADKAYVTTFYFLCLVLQNHRFNKKRCLINICLKGRNFILPFHLSKIWSNSMKDKHVKINTLTDLTFDSESVFKSQLSYLWTSYSLTSNLSLDSSRDSICHDDDLCYVYSKISPLCVHQEELHWRKALSVLWPVIPHGLHSAYNKGTFLIGRDADTDSYHGKLSMILKCSTWPLSFMLIVKLFN